MAPGHECDTNVTFSGLVVLSLPRRASGSVYYYYRQVKDLCAQTCLIGWIFSGGKDRDSSKHFKPFKNITEINAVDSMMRTIVE